MFRPYIASISNILKVSKASVLANGRTNKFSRVSRNRFHIKMLFTSAFVIRNTTLILFLIIELQ